MDVVLVIISLITGFLWKVAFDKYQKNQDLKDEAKNHDKNLFLDIRDKLLPHNRGIWFIREFAFDSGSYDDKKLDDFFYLSDVYAKDPTKKFIDKKLDNIRVKMFDIINKFVGFIAVHSHSSGNMHYKTLVTPYLEDHPEKLSLIINQVHALTDEIYDNYLIFIDYGKHKFKV